MNNKIYSAIQGSLTNLISGDIPNFQRSSPTWLEYTLFDSLRLEPVAAYQPAIDRSSGAIFLEPGCVNLVSHNIDLSENVWIKGSNCRIYPDEVESPDSSTFQADKIVWTSGEGLTQSLKRTLFLSAGKTYTLSTLLLLPNGEQARDNDIIRFNTGVSGNSAIQLSTLNAFPNRYRYLEMTFTTQGKQITMPKYDHNDSHTIASVAASSLNINFNAALVKDQLQGGTIQPTNSTKIYNILSNNAGTNNVTLTLDATNLIADGVKSTDKARIMGAADVAVELEFYVESTLSLHFGGIQIEERDFRTSMIYQNESLNIRAACYLDYRKNIIANLGTFGFFIEILDWRGEGNLFDAGNLSAKIVNNKLSISTSENNLNIDKVLSKNFKLFIQISEENSNISIYLNNLLELRTSIFNFVGDYKKAFSLTSNGYKAIGQIIVFDQALLDGQVKVGEQPKEEVGALFSSPTVLDATAIASNAPPTVLPPVTVPAPLAPIARSQIRGINNGSYSVTVQDATNFQPNKPVAVVRDGSVILRTKILTKTGNNLQLEVLYGAVLGDFLVFGNVDQPGIATVRFPYTPIDQAAIIEVNNTQNPARLKIASSLSFTKTRAIVTSRTYEDVTEVKIVNKDDNNGFLFVEDATGVQIGHIISQPKDELIIDPDCYEAYILKEVNGVEISAKYTNGVQLINKNPVPVEVQVAIRSSAY